MWQNMSLRDKLSRECAYMIQLWHSCHDKTTIHTGLQVAKVKISWKCDLEPKNINELFIGQVLSNLRFIISCMILTRTMGHDISVESTTLQSCSNHRWLVAMKNMEHSWRRDLVVLDIAGVSSDIPGTMVLYNVNGTVLYGCWETSGSQDQEM